MKIKHCFLFLAVLSLVLLSACTRSASTAYPKTIETDTEFPVLTEVGATQPPVEVFTTQTAQAVAKELTSVPPAVIATPTAEVVVEVVAAPVSQAPAEAAIVNPPAPQVTSSEPGFPVFAGYGPGFPTFGIRGVVSDQSVTIQANDFPEGETYTVRMGKYDSAAVGGVEVTSMESGEGGTYFETYNIPGSLMGESQIAIRIEFSDGRYAVNWFHNTTTY